MRAAPGCVQYGSQPSHTVCVKGMHEGLLGKELWFGAELPHDVLRVCVGNNMGHRLGKDSI